jgi:hypothetical protein
MSGIYKLLYRFDFQTAHWDARVAACLLLVWVLILICAISSIRSQSMSPGQQRFWIAVVVLVPIVGLLAYLPFAVKADDMPHYFRFRSKDRHRHGTRNEGKKQTRIDTP